MSSENPFEKSIWDLLEGDLSAEQFRELEATLLQNEEGRARFLEIADLHDLLHQKLSHRSSEPSVISMDEVIKRQQRRILKRSALAAAALLLLTGLVMSIILMRQSAPLLTFQHTEDAVFYTTHTENKVAADDGNELAIGSRLLLNEGTIELTFKSGVQAIVRAPADLGLLEKGRISQNEGVVRYVVPESATGFQVVTPDLLVTDLGTEFGVISHQDQADQVHLFKGKLEVESRKSIKTKEELVGVQSRVSEGAGYLATIDSSPELFKTSLEGRPPHVYLGFDELEDSQFEMGGNYPKIERNSAELVEGISKPLLIPGKVGNALELNGDGGYVQTGWKGITGKSPRSVAFWCKLPKPEKNSKSAGLVAWGNLRSLGHKFVIITNNDPNVRAKESTSI